MDFSYDGYKKPGELSNLDQHDFGGSTNAFSHSDRGLRSVQSSRPPTHGLIPGCFTPNDRMAVSAMGGSRNGHRRQCASSVSNQQLYSSNN